LNVVVTIKVGVAFGQVYGIAFILYPAHRTWFSGLE